MSDEPRARVVLYLDGDTREKLQKEADRLGISLNGFIRMLLSNYFDGIRFEQKR